MKRDFATHTTDRLKRNTNNNINNNNYIYKKSITSSYDTDDLNNNNNNNNKKNTNKNDDEYLIKDDDGNADEDEDSDDMQDNWHDNEDMADDDYNNNHRISEKSTQNLLNIFDDYEGKNLILIKTPPSSTFTRRFNNRRFIKKSKRHFTSWAIIGFTFILFLLLLYIPLFNNVQSRAVSIVGWNRNTTRDTTFYVLPHLNTTILNPSNVCTERLFLLIVVCSSATNFETRQTIRETWGNVTEFNYSFFAKVHAKLKGKYLNINYKDWKNYSLPIVNLLSPLKSSSTSTTTTTTTTTTPSILSSVSSISNNQLLNDAHPNANLPFSSSQYQNFAVKVVFLLGQLQNNDTQMKINSEHEKYEDIIQESFIDSYNNLTLKTIMMLKWINRNCLDKVKFLMKCDDDTFVNVPNLLHVLMGGTVPVYNATVHEYDQITVKATSSYNRLNQKFKLLLGSRFCKSKPIANVSSKWYTPIYMYSGNIYPNYLSGSGYVMSMDVAIKLYNASLNIPLFHLEDVYLTGICAEAIKIKPRNHHLFSYTSYKKPCELKGMITKHELTSQDMKDAYEFVTNTSVNCPKPDKYFHVRKVKTFIRNCN